MKELGFFRESTADSDRHILLNASGRSVSAAEHFVVRFVMAPSPCLVHFVAHGLSKIEHVMVDVVDIVRRRYGSGNFIQTCSQTDWWLYHVLQTG